MSSKEKNRAGSSATKYNKLLKVLALLLVFVLISLVSGLLLYLFDIIYFEDGIQLNRELFNQFSTKWYGFIIVMLIQTIVTSLLSFVPGISMAFIILIQKLYSNTTMAFLVSFSGVMFTSLMMYIIGRFGGYTIGKKLLGEEDCEKASKLLNTKGLIYFPFMMMFPIFPDDALVMVAGTLKMSLKWFVPSIVFGRGIGVATIVFGISFTDYLTTVWHWIAFIVFWIAFIVGVFFAANRFNKYMDKKSKMQAAEAEKTEKVDDMAEEI